MRARRRSGPSTCRRRSDTGFRTELRDLLMRAVERGLEPEDLTRWVAARAARVGGRRQVLAEYDEVTAFSRPGSYDPAWILGAAADLLEEDDEALDRLRGSLDAIVVDDAQELTSAAARLLQVVRAPHIDLMLVGDPDSAVQTFRGADPRLLGTAWTAPRRRADAAAADGIPPAEALRVVSHRVTRRIGAAGGWGTVSRSPSGPVAGST